MSEQRAGTVATNGIRLAYRSIGRGPVLLPIIGYRLSGHAWPFEFIDSLARHFQVILFDNRGTGDSDMPMHGYGMDNLARDALGLLDALEIERAHVLGYSMGGAIAQELSCAAPDRVSRLVLCNTWSGLSTSVLAHPSAYLAMAALWFRIPGAAQHFWSVTYGRDHLATNRLAVHEQWERENQWPTPPWITALQYDGMRRFEILRRLPAIRCPTLVLAGADDELVPPGNAKIIAGQIPNAHMRVLPGIGHRAFWETPKAMAKIIEDFLNEEAQMSQDERERHEPAQPAY